MSNSATLTSLTAIVRAKLNMTNMLTITDTDIQTFLQDSLSTLYELLVSTWQDWYVINTQLSLIANQEGYTLPTNFRAEAAVYLIFQPGTTSVQRQQLRPFQMNQFANTSPGFLTQPQWPIMYRIMNNMIYFTPVPAQAYTNAVDLWYTPQWTPPATVTSPIDANLPQGWERWVVLDTCVAVAAARRLPDYYQMYAGERKEVQAVVLRGATRRDETPQVMTDAYMTGTGWGFGGNPGT